VNYSGFSSSMPSATRARMLAVFPQLQDVRNRTRLGREVDIRQRAPHFGRLRQCHFLQGFSGHGIALTGIAGKLVAEAIAESPGASRVCADSTPQFPGGTGLRRPALVLAMLYYASGSVVAAGCPVHHSALIYRQLMPGCGWPWVLYWGSPRSAPRPRSVASRWARACRTSCRCSSALALSCGRVFRGTGLSLAACHLARLNWRSHRAACAGLAFTVWARVYLGRNWSGIGDPQQRTRAHSLGSLRLLRHPIYTGFIEERFMREIFPGSTRANCAEVPALVPSQKARRSAPR